MHRSPIGPIRRILAALALLPLLAARGAAQAEDEWQLMHIDDAKVGFVHVVVEKVEQDGRVLWKTSTDTSLTMNRLGTNVTILATGITLEDEGGRIVEVSSETNMSTSKTLVHARVDGDKAEVTRRIAGPPQVQTMEWNRDWIGDQAIERLTLAKIAAGEKEFTYSTWRAETGPVVVTAQVLGWRKVQVPGGGERELQQMRTTIDVQPGMITDSYLDDAGRTVMTVTKIMGMNMITTQASKSACLAAFANPDTPEVFDKLSPRTNVRLPAPYRTTELVLHVKAADPEVPLPPLEDERQTVVERLADDELVLRVARVVPDGSFTLPLADLTPEEQECLKPSVQIESDHPRIVELAKQAAGDEGDAWEVACRLEKFAFEYITNKSLGSLFWTAAEVAEKRAGDCTEHGVFLAGLCRAAGIPARVAVGFLYFKGIWGGHMWTEISLGGNWYALDAVLGHGGVDAAHLRLGADSLVTTEIDRVFSNVGLGMTMKIDLRSYRHGDKEVRIGEDMRVSSIEDDRYRHLLYGISLTSPEGYVIRPNEAIRMGDDRIVELDHPTGPDIRIDVMDVTYDFKLDDVKETLAARGIARVKGSDREIDGRPGRVFRGKKDKTEHVTAAVLRDETLVLVGCRLAEGEDDQALAAVLDSLDLDG